MSKNYNEIISIVRGDIDRLEKSLVENIVFPTNDLNELFLAPAKRIRPILAFLFLKAIGKEITNEQLELQVAVELAHTASLIHDDIIDMAQKRRGIVTLNQQYNDKIAVLSGDYILSIALKKLVSTNNNQILQDFLSTFSQMASGEISQFFAKNKIPTMEKYIEKTIQKTAGLFVVSLKSSAILANIDYKNIEEFALNFGIAFQIKNDLENVLNLGDDIKNGIYTAPVIFSGSTKITEKAINKTKLLINEYINNAEKFVDKLPQNIYSQALRNILELYRYD